HRPPIVGLHAGATDALVPDLGCPLVGCDRRRRVAIAQACAFESHGGRLLTLVLEVGGGAAGGTVALAQGLRWEQGGVRDLLPSCQGLRPRRWCIGRCTAKGRHRYGRSPAGGWRRRIAITLRCPLAVGIGERCGCRGQRARCRCGERRARNPAAATLFVRRADTTANGGPPR